MKKMTTTLNHNLIRGIFTLLLAIFAILFFSMSAKAADVEDTNIVMEESYAEEINIVIEESNETASITPFSINGYAATYTDSLAGEFYITSNGSSTSKGGLTFQSNDFASSGATIVITLYRPDNTVALTKQVNTNSKVEFSFTNAQQGTYRIVYSLLTSNKGWLHAWVYSK